jgi:hypothetical protein
MLCLRDHNKCSLCLAFTGSQQDGLKETIYTEDDNEYTESQPSEGQETLGLLCTLCYLLFKHQN